LVRQLAQQAHRQSDGSSHVYTRGTLDRWISAYRERGLEGLRPQPRADAGVVRQHPELLDEAARLRQELPGRSAAQLCAILLARHGIRIPERTVRQYLTQRGLQRVALAGPTRVYGRFEADRPNEVWIGDVLVGPFVPHPRQAGSQRAYLFVLVDDYSRLLLHARWCPEQTARAGQEVLRAAIQRRGLPERLYVDNGAPYANAAILRTCAVLGIHLIHSRPYAPQGRGKQERLNRFIRERFLLEAEAQGITSFQELNDHFLAWAEQVCNTRQHAETGELPIVRFLSQEPPRTPEPALLREAFRAAVLRQVSRTATVAFAGRQYAVDPALVGRRVELRYDPNDPGNADRLDVYCDGRPWGGAALFRIGRHVAAPLSPPIPTLPPPTPTGVDYLGLVQAAHEAQTLGEIAFRDLPGATLEAEVTPPAVTGDAGEALR
jgi:putative transposase